jgi:hypothetical protein
MAVIALGAITRIAAALVLGDRFHFGDEAGYVDAARRLLGGQGFGADYVNVPAQPIFLALLAVPWPESVLLLRCAHALAVGLLGGLVLYVLGTRTVGADATRVALLLYALDPLLVVAGGLLYPDAIAAVVVAGILLAAAIATRHDRWTASVITGILLGLAIQFRPVAVVLLPFVALWSAAFVAAPAVRRVGHALLVALACALTVAPWVVHNLTRDGHVFPTAMPGIQGAPVATADVERHGLVASIGREAWRDPAAMARRVAREFAHFWELYPTRLVTDVPAARVMMHREDPRLPTESSFSPGLRDAVSAASFGIELTLALVGLASARRSRGATVLFAGVAILYGLGYALFIAKMRYRIAVLPCVFLLAGLGATAIRAHARSVVRHGRRA